MIKWEKKDYILQFVKEISVKFFVQGPEEHII